jgi:hypothetical protein
MGLKMLGHPLSSVYRYDGKFIWNPNKLQAIPWYMDIFYSAFNRGGNRERSVKPEQHLSRIAGVTADSGISQ